MCKKLGKFYLTAINVVTALLGLVIVGIASYALGAYSDIDAILSRSATWVVLAVGLVLFFVSILGCKSAQSQNRCGLFIYIAVVCCLGAAQLIGGATIAVYAGELETDNGSIEDLSDELQDFVNCSRSWCCSGNGDGCGDITLWNSPGFCTVLPDELQDKDSDECKSEELYNDALIQWLKDNQQALAIACIVIGSIEVLAVFFALWLMCSKKPEEEEAARKKKEAAEAEKGKPQYEKAGNVAGTNYV